MGQAVGQILPLAVGVALSPIPIIAVVLMLVSERARVNGPAFVIGWLVGLAVVGAFVLAVAGGIDTTDDGEPATWVGVLKLVLGLLLLLVGAKQWRGRPAEGEEPPPPKWMGAIDGFGPGKAAGLGALLSGLNPKNTLLAIGAGVAIAQAGISTGEQVASYAIFALIGTLGVAAPVVIYFALGERSQDLLGRLKGWMGRNTAVIMAVLMLVIGVKLIGDAIGDLD
jgi:threonine/homoserine/homoserine lactone efflux protein